MTINVHSGGDLFIAKKGRVSRARDRTKGIFRNPSASVAAEALKAREEKAEWERRIRATIAKDSLESLLQPIVALSDGRAVGAEALARFSEGPVRSPAVWFAEAAAVGLGVELELTALRAALSQLPRLASSVYLSVNASVEALMSEEFRTRLAEAPGERIVLELTEHSGVADYMLFEQTIQDLRAHGVRLAVDDAGAGYSSFRHVLKLRPDVIKLDISLTRGIDKDPARRALSSALLTFGLDAYNAAVVAEGIETLGEFKTLSALGFPFGQGYYLGRPERLPAQLVGSALLPSHFDPAHETLDLASESGTRAPDRVAGSRDSFQSRQVDTSDPAPPSSEAKYAQFAALFAKIKDAQAYPDAKLAS
jgi:EAL domain-containing protein (putative c-di-GMP-specific phosphodiesterase class I)